MVEEILDCLEDQIDHDNNYIESLNLIAQLTTAEQLDEYIRKLFEKKFVAFYLEKVIRRRPEPQEISDNHIQMQHLNSKLKDLPLCVHNNDSKMVTFVRYFTNFFARFGSLLNKTARENSSENKEERREMSSGIASLFKEFGKDEIVFPVLSGLLIAYHKTFKFNYREAQDILNIIVRFGITASSQKSSEKY